MTQELDFYDITLKDPFAEVPIHSSLSFRNDTGRTTVTEEETIQYEEDYLQCGFGFDGEEAEESKMCPPDESTIEPQEEEEEVKVEEEQSRNLEEECQSEFRTSLWSVQEVSTVRPSDEWNLPLGPVAWDDNDKPVERLLQYAELQLTPEEESGLLTDRIVAACCSYLTSSPETKDYVAAKVCLNNKNLNDIRILGCHRFLQYVDLSWNNLRDLTPLGNIPYLMYLDVSHNLLESVLQFKTPWNLTYVNYSHNSVWRIDDLSEFWSLSYLDLSHNKISKIQGLHNLRYLRHLDLSHNKIERFENLSHLRITDLNLEFNLISAFEMDENTGATTMLYLTNMYLNNNLINELSFLQGVYRLKKLELQHNSITDLFEISHMKSLKNLRLLDLTANPVTSLKPYRNLVLSTLPALQFIDQTEVDLSEKVTASKNKSYDMQLASARNSALMLLLDQLNDPSIELDVLPVDQGAYPLVVLVGPSASSKKFLVVKLGEKYSQKICIGRLHTTRDPLETDKSLFVKVSREEFQEKVKAGHFLCTMELLGHLYGFSREMLAKAIKEHKLCLTCMDMEGALTLHSYGIQPFLVLTIPKSAEEHTERLKKNYGAIKSFIGAAQMAERDFCESHSCVMKRVEDILDEILKQVVRIIEKRQGSTSPETTKKYAPSSRWASEGDASHRCGAIWCSQGECSFCSLNPGSVVPETDRSEPTATEKTLRALSCKCTPRACGKCMRVYPKEDTMIESTNRRTENSGTTSRMGEAGEETRSSLDTSYSAIDFSSFRREDFSFEGSVYGEHDPFAGWSLPYLDWDSVNQDQQDLEEAAERLCEKYIQSVMSTRDVYQSIHTENPGLFSLCVFTDNTGIAIEKISKFLKDVWTSTPNRKPIFEIENDEICKRWIPRKLERYNEMLRYDRKPEVEISHFKTSDEEPVRPAPTIVSHMQMMGFEESLETL